MDFASSPALGGRPDKQQRVLGASLLLASAASSSEGQFNQLDSSAEDRRSLFMIDVSGRLEATSPAGVERRRSHLDWHHEEALGLCFEVARTQ